MCNCMNEVMQSLKEKMELESIEEPTDLLTCRAYLEFTVKEKGKKKERKMPVLLPRCPFCGEPYDEKQMKAID